jgi:7-cyano-7-deazaguanine synthase
VKKSIVLLSGGLDSTVMLADVLETQSASDVLALTVDYGQRHVAEVECARAIAQHYGVEHRISTGDLRAVGGSALTSSSNMRLERGRAISEMVGVPSSYVPARNTIMLAFAQAWAESSGAHRVYIGATVDDFDGYPDCRPKFFTAFGHMATLAGPRSLAVHAPLSECTKREVVALGVQLGVDFQKTLSCYDPPAASGSACGYCDACVKRLHAFAANGIADPTTYVRGES